MSTTANDAAERARQAWERNERRVDVQLRLAPGLADRDLEASLDKIIDALEQAADAGLSLPPRTIRAVVDAITASRDCHRHLTEAERDLANVVSIDTPRSRRV